MNVPEHLVYPMLPFAADFAAKVSLGEAKLKRSSVAFVGLARNCGKWLADNLSRLEVLVGFCGDWSLHIETNDNQDDTVPVLERFCERHKQASFCDQTLGRGQFTTEFAGPRTIALAEYRTACQEWVRTKAGGATFVVVIDFDAWGGWSHAGFLNGIGWLKSTPEASGMASVSLLQYPVLSVSEGSEPCLVPGWVHYDAWALRVNSTWDDYTAGHGGWKHQWLPPVGSPPIKVCSAFGGMGIYRTGDYLAGAYDGAKDCEHVYFHESVARVTGRHVHLCPGMRTVMRWMEPTDGGQHSNH
jgi:hypothetical protein